METVSLSIDESVLRKLSIAVQEARGERSQREFAKLLNVSQSTVLQWESGRNVPNLENLEKIARLKGMLVEDFVAYLYDRTRGLTSKDILDRVEVMPSGDFAQILRVMAERLDTAQNAPPVAGKPEKGVTREDAPIRLDLPQKMEGLEDLEDLQSDEQGDN